MQQRRRRADPAPTRRTSAANTITYRWLLHHLEVLKRSRQAADAQDAAERERAANIILYRWLIHDGEARRKGCRRASRRERAARQIQRRLRARRRARAASRSAEAALRRCVAALTQQLGRHDPAQQQVLRCWHNMVQAESAAAATRQREKPISTAPPQPPLREQRARAAGEASGGGEAIDGKQARPRAVLGRPRHCDGVPPCGPSDVPGTPAGTWICYCPQPDQDGLARGEPIGGSQNNGTITALDPQPAAPAELDRARRDHWHKVRQSKLAACEASRLRLRRAAAARARHRWRVIRIELPQLVRAERTRQLYTRLAAERAQREAEPPRRTPKARGSVGAVFQAHSEVAPRATAPYRGQGADTGAGVGLKEEEAEEILRGLEPPRRREPDSRAQSPKERRQEPAPQLPSPRTRILTKIETGRGSTYCCVASSGPSPHVRLEGDDLLKARARYTTLRALVVAHGDPGTPRPGQDGVLRDFSEDLERIRPARLAATEVAAVFKNRLLTMSQRAIHGAAIKDVYPQYSSQQAGDLAGSNKRSCNRWYKELMQCRDSDSHGTAAAATALAVGAADAAAPPTESERPPPYRAICTGCPGCSAPPCGVCAPCLSRASGAERKHWKCVKRICHVVGNTAQPRRQDRDQPPPPPPPPPPPSGGNAGGKQVKRPHPSGSGPTGAPPAKRAGGSGAGPSSSESGGGRALPLTNDSSPPIGRKPPGLQRSPRRGECGSLYNRQAGEAAPPCAGNANCTGCWHLRHCGVGGRSRLKALTFEPASNPTKGIPPEVAKAAMALPCSLAATDNEGTSLFLGHPTPEHTYLLSTFLNGGLKRTTVARRLDCIGIYVAADLRTGTAHQTRIRRNPLLGAYAAAIGGYVLDAGRHRTGVAFANEGGWVNAFLVPVTLHNRGEAPDLTLLGLFAAEDILQGAEVRTDYGDAYGEVRQAAGYAATRRPDGPEPFSLEEEASLPDILTSAFSIGALRLLARWGGLWDEESVHYANQSRTAGQPSKLRAQPSLMMETAGEGKRIGATKEGRDSRAARRQRSPAAARQPITISRQASSPSPAGAQYSSPPPEPAREPPPPARRSLTEQETGRGSTFLNTASSGPSPYVRFLCNICMCADDVMNAREQGDARCRACKPPEERSAASSSAHASAHGTLTEDAPKGAGAAVCRGVLCFHKPKEVPFGPLSNGYDCPIQLDGHTYSSAEAVIMALKAKLFNDEATLAKIQEPGLTPRQYRLLGRQVSGFNEETWRLNRESLARLAVSLKFDQNAELAQLLESTGSTTLVAASPTDSIWGAGAAWMDIRAGAAWSGSNTLGEALMWQRRRAREATAPSPQHTCRMCGIPGVASLCEACQPAVTPACQPAETPRAQDTQKSCRLCWLPCTGGLCPACTPTPGDAVPCTRKTPWGNCFVGAALNKLSKGERAAVCDAHEDLLQRLLAGQRPSLEELQAMAAHRGVFVAASTPQSYSEELMALLIKHRGTQPNFVCSAACMAGERCHREHLLQALRALGPASGPEARQPASNPAEPPGQAPRESKAARARPTAAADAEAAEARRVRFKNLEGQPAPPFQTAGAESRGARRAHPGGNIVVRMPAAATLEALADRAPEGETRSKLRRLAAVKNEEAAPTAQQRQCAELQPEEPSATDGPPPSASSSPPPATATAPEEIKEEAGSGAPGAHPTPTSEEGTVAAAATESGPPTTAQGKPTCVGGGDEAAQSARETGTPSILHLFAGPERTDGLQAALKPTGYGAVEYDRDERSADHDLAQETRQRRILHDIANKRYVAILIGSPCTSYTVRHDSAEAWRTEEHPGGRPDLSEAAKAWLREQDALLEFCIAVIEAALDTDTPVILENPAPRDDPELPSYWPEHADKITVWRMKCMKELRRRRAAQLRLVIIPQCAFGKGPSGHLYQKYTGLLCSIEAARYLESLDLRCTHTAAEHDRIQGTTQDGVALSKLAAAYPGAMFQALAVALLHARLRWEALAMADKSLRGALPPRPASYNSMHAAALALSTPQGPAQTPNADEPTKLRDTADQGAPRQAPGIPRPPSGATGTQEQGEARSPEDREGDWGYEAKVSPEQAALNGATLQSATDPTGEAAREAAAQAAAPQPQPEPAQGVPLEPPPLQPPQDTAHPANVPGEPSLARPLSQVEQARGKTVPSARHNNESAGAAALPTLDISVAPAARQDNIVLAPVQTSAATAAEPLVLLPLHRGVFGLPETPHRRNHRREAAVEAAAAVAERAGMTKDACFLAGEIDAIGQGFEEVSGTRTSVVVAPCRPDTAPAAVARTPQELRALQEATAHAHSGAAPAVWTTAAALAADSTTADGHVRYRAAAVAIAMAEAHIRPTAEGPNFMRTGARPGRRAQAPTSKCEPGAIPLSERIRRARAAADALRAALLEVDPEVEAPFAAFCRELAPQVQSCGVDQMPEELLGIQLPKPPADLLSRAFKHNAQVRRTQPKPHPEPQRPPPDGWWPHSIEDIIEPWALARIRDWLRRCAEWHQRGGDERTRPEPEAYGEDAIRPQARGRRWDLRGGPGKIKLWRDYTPEECQARTCIDLKFAERLFADCVDKELTDFLLKGVRFHANLQPQIVLMPNLLSLYREGGISAAAAQVDDMVRSGFIAVFDEWPSVPLRLVPRGIVPKPGTDELRGIADQGAPRKPLRTQRPPGDTSSTQEQVEALNQKCREGDWDHEDKDNLEHAAFNGAILQAIADLTGEVTLEIALDMSKWFHRMFYEALDLWTTGALVPSKATGTLKIAIEMALTMGATPASQIAQRFANAMVQKVCQRMDEAEAEARAKNPLSPETQTVLDHRNATIEADSYSSQGRLYDLTYYTDDGHAMVVGTERTIRFLRAFWSVAGPEGLRAPLSRAAKQQLGICVKWLGGALAAGLGLIWIPRDKAARAALGLADAIANRMEVGEYRRLAGFLVSIHFMVGSDKTLLSHIFRPVKPGNEIDGGPQTLVYCDELMRATLQRWQALVLNTPGAPALSAAAPTPPCTTAPRHRIRTDAALQGTPSPGLGGCMYGTWWAIAIADWPGLEGLDIPHLELLAACVGLITFAEMLSEAEHVELDTDALATAVALTDRAKSPDLQAILDILMLRPEYQALARRLGVSQLFGAANIMSDAASRGYINTLNAVADALGIKTKRIEISEAAADFLTDAVTAITRRRAQASWGATSRGTHNLNMDGNMPIAHSEGDSPARSPGGAPPPPAPRHQMARPALTSHAWASPGPTAWRDAPPPPRGQPARSPPEAWRERQSPAKQRRTWAQVASPRARCRIVPSPQQEPPPPAATGGPHRPRAARALGPSMAEVEFQDAVPPPARAPAAAARPQLDAPAPPPARRTAPPPVQPAMPPDHTSRQPQRPPSELELARHRLRHSLVDRLAGDSSEHALKCERSFLEWMCEVAQGDPDDTPVTTQSNLRSNWRHWERFITEAGAGDPWRPNVETLDSVGVERERVLWTAGLIWIYKYSMRPKPGRLLQYGDYKGLPAPCKPESALAILRGVRKEHLDRGLTPPTLTLATRRMHELTRRYAKFYGPENLVPQKKSTLTHALIKEMLGIPEDAHVPHRVPSQASGSANDDALQGRRAAGRLWSWRSSFGASYAALIHTLAQTGFRKAEVALGNEEWGNMHISFANLTWRLGGVDTATPTAAQLFNIRRGDYAILRPPPSKCDPYSARWGNSPIYLPFCGNATINAARALARWELAARVQPSERAKTPLFCGPGGAGTPLTQGVCDDVLESMLTYVTGSPEAAKKYSVHSFRSFVASSMLAAKCTDAQIQAALRWASAEALQEYKNITPEAYGEWLLAAERVKLNNVMRARDLPRMPRTDDLDHMVAIQAAQAQCRRDAEVADQDRGDTSAIEVMPGRLEPGRTEAAMRERRSFAHAEVLRARELRGH